MSNSQPQFLIGVEGASVSVRHDNFYKLSLKLQ